MEEELEFYKKKAGLYESKSDNLLSELDDNEELLKSTVNDNNELRCQLARNVQLLEDALEALEERNVDRSRIFCGNTPPPPKRSRIDNDVMQTVKHEPEESQEMIHELDESSCLKDP